MIIVEILFTVSKQYQFCFEMPLLQVFTYKSRGLYLFPLDDLILGVVQSKPDQLIAGAICFSGKIIVEIDD